MSEKKELKVLNLIIKQVYFDAIMQGRKVQEFREVRPTTYKKLVELDEDGSIKLDDAQCNSVPIQYDAIRFLVGYSKDRDSALVEVLSAESQMYIDEDGEVITYEYNGETWYAEHIVYNLGKILEHSIRDKS